jgi:uncharacterized membrane protein YfhO
MDILSIIGEVGRRFLLWMSQIIFVLSIVILLAAEQYSKLEKILEKEVGGIRKKVIPKLETNIYSFHDWLLKRRVILSLIFIIYPILTFFNLLKR